MSMKSQAEAGFTMVELLCTLSILGLLLSLAIPNLTARISNAEYVQLQYQIVSQLDDAQLLAMAEEKDVSVQFTDQAVITWAEGKAKQKTKFPESTKIWSNYPKNRVLFQETGHVRGGTIMIKQNNQKWMEVVIQVASGTTKVRFHV